MWVQVVDDDGEALTSVIAVYGPLEVAADLRHALKNKFPHMLSSITTPHLRVYASEATYSRPDAKPLGPGFNIEEMGKNENEPLVVVAPLKEMSALHSPVFVEALDIGKPRLLRPNLIERVESSLKQNQFVLFSTPTYLGKTSLFQLFDWDCVKLSFVGVSLRDRRVPPIYALLNAGIDFKKKDFSRLRAGRAYLFFLDSAETHYDDKEFWKALITDAPSWLPSNYRFIISATDGLYTEEPTELGKLPRFGMRDFLVSAEESRILLILPMTGLPTSLQYDRLFSVIVQECNGHVGALKIAIHVLKWFLLEHPSPSEAELVAHYLSNHSLSDMSGCFGNDCHTSPESVELREFLIVSLFPNFSPMRLGKLLDDDPLRYAALKQHGILFDYDDGRVCYSSPLAERYYCKWLFPMRATSLPSTLRELVTKVLGSISATTLRQPSKKKGVVDEGTFQGRFLEALATHTPAECSICHEISRVFQFGPVDKARSVDFFVNMEGGPRWGIQLFLNGNTLLEKHQSRFHEDGQYGLLAVSDYALMEVPASMEGGRANLHHSNKDISCRCVFGTEKTSALMIIGMSD